MDEAIDVLDVEVTKDCEEDVGGKEPLLGVVEIVDVNVEVETEIDDSRTVTDGIPEEETSLVLALVDESVGWSTGLAVVEFGCAPGGPLPPS